MYRKVQTLARNKIGQKQDPEARDRSFVAARLNLGSLTLRVGSFLRPLRSFGVLPLNFLATPWIFRCIFPKRANLNT